MYKNLKVGIFVPAYNEEENIGEVLKTMPDYVDTILVVDDHSQDKTSEVVKKYIKKDPRILLERNEKNQGNGYGAKFAYQKLVELGLDLIAPMAGDGQTEPQYLPRLLEPVVEGRCDLAKGNRFLEPAVYKQMPRHRYVGNIFITMLNKFSTGYYSMFDSLNGYYVARADVLKKIDFEQLGDRYEFENSFWVQLNIVGARVKDVSIPPIYKNEHSKIKLTRVVLPTLWTLQKGFVKRILQKYVLYNFSPIGLFYIAGTLLTWFGIILGVIIAITSIGPPSPSTATVMAAVVPFILGVQLLLQAVVLDIQDEPKCS
jgi:glycosyltransferase involved in cell wall biosynthesis